MKGKNSNFYFFIRSVDIQVIDCGEFQLFFLFLFRVSNRHTYSRGAPPNVLHSTSEILEKRQKNAEKFISVDTEQKTAKSCTIISISINNC